MSDLPPPPSSPPPSGPPEYLGGAPADSARSSRGRRTTLAAVGGVLAVGVVGAGAWAAWSFFATGPQPAQALPASTLGYVSVDLDPSGGQKIEALRTLRKFPAFKDNVDLDTDDDIREWIVEQIQEEGACPDLDYGEDIEPWLGDRFAVAAVPGEDIADPVFVLQVGDADAAEAGIEKIRACGGEAGDSEDAGAWSVAGDWLVVAETQDIVDDVIDGAADGALADDEDFKRWSGEAGGDGIVAMYAAPAVGDLLADNLDEIAEPLGGAMPGVLGDDVEDPYADLCSDADLAAGLDEDLYADLCASSGSAPYSDDLDDPEDVLPPELGEALREFGGAAAAIRFADGGLEFEFAADAGATGQTATVGDTAGDLAGSLPEGTAAAFAMSFAEGWFQETIERFAAESDTTAEEIFAELNAELGLELPEDAETLLGDAIAVAVSPDVDLGTTFDLFGEAAESEPPTGFGLKVRGDAEEIDDVLGRLEGGLGDTGGFLDRDLGDDAVALGPDADYRAELLDDGGLGGSDPFEDVIEEAGQAGMLLFIDFDAGSNWLAELAADDPEVRDNLEPLAAFGLSAWLDGDVAHGALRITTD